MVDNGKLIMKNYIDEITAKYQFISVPTIENNTDFLYYERSIDGFRAVKENTDNIETDIDIELLFNAIDNKRIQNL